MSLECSHIMMNASDLAESRAFYVETLGFPVVEEYPQMFAFRAGAVRFTVVSGGYRLDPEPEREPNTTLMFRSSDLEATVSELKGKGVAFLGEIHEAPGFMKHVALLDPDNNLLYLAEYYRDPLEPV